MKSNPLDNWGTAKVFYKLVSGKTNTKQLAESLNVSPPSISEQLHRLQTLGIVKLGKKEGKVQPYEIDWKIMTQVLVEESPKLKFILTFKPKSKVEKKLSIRPKRMAEMVKVQLPKEERFQKLILEYFKGLSLRLEYIGYSESVTLQNAIEDFEAFLIRVITGLKHDEKTKNLFWLLISWCEVLEESNPFTFDAAEEALKKIGLLPL